MPRSDWLRNATGIAVATLGVFVLGVFIGRIELASDAKPPSRNQAACAEGDYAHCDTSPKILDPVSGEYRPADPNEAAYRDEYRAERDLNAQWAMAFWAAAMFVATSLGVVLIYFTLRESMKAARFAAATLREAENATKAAIDTTKVTREMGQAQSRCYLSVSDAFFKFIPDQISPVIKFTVLNSGHTPAKQVSVVYGVNYDPDGKPLPHSELRIRELTDFGAGERREVELEIPWSPMPQGYFEKWMAGEEVPIFEGWFRFRDVFKDRWKVPFQFEAFYEAFDINWDYSPLDVPAWRFPLLTEGKDQ